MRIGIFSDLHLDMDEEDEGRVEGLDEYSPWDYEPDPSIFYINAGDTHPDPWKRVDLTQRFKNTNYFYILGNHDYWQDSFLGQSIEETLFATEDRRVKVVGATLWTNLEHPVAWGQFVSRMKDYKNIGDLTWDVYRATHAYQRDYLLNSHADVIVTHHAPSWQSIGEDYIGDLKNTSFVSHLDPLIEKMEKPPKLWVHGHVHGEFDYMIGETRVVCHPRGYPWERRNKGRVPYVPKVVEI
jgi:predicted phosphohydrolase